MNSRSVPVDGSTSGRSVVLHPQIGYGPSRSDPVSRLEEAKSLAKAIQLFVAHAEIVRISKPRSSHLIGKGNVSRLGLVIKTKKVQVAVIDTALTPVQQRNLERVWECKVLDRTGLIIEIFGARAKTREGVLQVELAALNYQRSRLVRSWTHLERQKGGAGFMGGPGETQIESDKRLIGERISKIKKDLKEVRRTRTLHREARRRVPYPVIALVGYTNAGKSTIFNSLTGAHALSKNQVFVTLDPTMRLLKLPSGIEAILSDTVGFISEIPYELVEAFQATFEEVIQADLIINVRDISHPDTENQDREVRQVLNDMGIFKTSQFKMIEIRNKLDRLDYESRKFQFNRAVRSNDSVVLTSAKTGQGFDILLRTIDLTLNQRATVKELRISWDDGNTLAWLYECGQIIDRHNNEDGIKITVKLSNDDAARLENKLSLNQRP